MPVKDLTRSPLAPASASWPTLLCPHVTQCGMAWPLLSGHVTNTFFLRSPPVISINENSASAIETFIPLSTSYSAWPVPKKMWPGKGGFRLAILGKSDCRPARGLNDEDMSLSILHPTSLLCERAGSVTPIGHS